MARFRLPKQGSRGAYYYGSPGAWVGTNDEMQPPVELASRRGKRQERLPLRIASYFDMLGPFLQIFGLASRT